MAADAVIAAAYSIGILSVARHHADDDPADADGVGNGGAGHSREDDVRHDIDVTEAAAKPADKHKTEFQKPIGEASAVHQIRGEDEQRHRQQNVAVEQTVQDLLAGGPKVEARDEQIEHRRADHRQADRQPEQRERDQDDDAQREIAGH